MDRKEQIQRAKELLESGVLSEESAEAIKADFPELSESEDERIRKRLIEEMRHFQREAAKESCDADFEFAKSAIAYLEKQKEQKPAEWSEKDENKIESIKGLITTGRFVDTNTIRTIWKLLDSLRPQPHWKPSEEQIWALERAITTCERIGGDQSRLKALCEQLKLM